MKDDVKFLNSNLEEIDDDISEKEFLEKYDETKYKSPSVAVDILIFTISNKHNSNYRKNPEKELQILLIKRKKHPYKDCWALPGGFNEIDESLDDTAVRELKEETNVEFDDVYMEQLYTFGDVERDPRKRVISCSYITLSDKSKLNIKAGDDAKEAKLFTIDRKVLEQNKQVINNGYILSILIELNLTNDEEQICTKIKSIKSVKNHSVKYTYEIIDKDKSSFDHAMIINYAIERIQNKIVYTDIAFSLLPEVFTVNDIQNVYRAILNKEIYHNVIKRKTKGMIIKTGEKKKGAGHSPAELYKFNPDWIEETI